MSVPIDGRKSDPWKVKAACAIIAIAGLALLGLTIFGFIVDWLAMLELIGLVVGVAFVTLGIPWAFITLEDR